MVQATQSRQRLNPAPAPWVDSHWTTGWRVLGQPQMGSIFMVQVDNQIPIVLNCEKSIIRGIRGMGVLSGFMEHL